MDGFEQRLARLERFFPLTEGNAEAFLQEVAALTASKDRRVVAPILLLADDHCRLAGIMDDMLSQLEEVSLAEYVDEFLEALPAFYANSPRYARREIKKLLWTDAARPLLVVAARGLSREKAAALVRILSEISEPSLAGAIGAVQSSLVD
ncbi:MAG: hypothetical protein JST92_14360 [Deltaproteobacteria bacterium]|nr:hypothetical protein [Deltaproteobacteria bacterium]